MVARAAVLAHPASAHALLDGLVGDLERDDMIEPDTGCLERFRLRDRAGHTVEDVALRTIGFGKTGF